MRRRRGYKFTEKSHSAKGLISFGASVVWVLLYLIFVYLSFRKEGSLSTYYGSAGVIVLILSIVTLTLSITDLMEEDSFKLFPKLGVGISVLAVLLWGGTYILGFVL